MRQIQVRDQSGRVSWLLTVALIVLASICAAALLAWKDYRRFVDAPLLLGEPRVIDFSRGTGFREIVRQLRRERITDGSPFYWRVLSRELNVASRLHAGEYSLQPGLTPRGLIEMMAAGKVVQHQFTVVEGWTFRQLRLALVNAEGIGQTLGGLDDASIAARLDIPEGKPEGWFLPETYAWVKGDNDFAILSRAHAAMRSALERLWPGRDPDLPLATPYDALILASIIEKETGVADERGLIGGVFTRRLRIGMRLQTDPTVVYGMGETYDGNIRRRDLETDTEFNTYTRAGLPPTPIALPGLSALQAALHPADGNALYFVAVGDGTGRHEFSATLNEHNRAVSRYLARSRQR